MSRLRAYRAQLTPSSLYRLRGCRELLRSPARWWSGLFTALDPPAYVPEFRIVVDQLPKRRSPRKAVDFISKPRLDFLIVLDQRGAFDPDNSNSTTVRSYRHAAGQKQHDQDAAQPVFQRRHSGLEPVVLRSPRQPPCGPELSPECERLIRQQTSGYRGQLEDAKEGVLLFLSLRGRDARDVFHDPVNEGDRFIVLWGARQIDNGERHYVVELLTRTTGEPNPYRATLLAIAPHVEANSLVEWQLSDRLQSLRFGWKVHLLIRQRHTMT